MWCLPLRHVIRPSTTLTWDSMHCFLSNGVANTEVDVMLARLHQHGITFCDIHSLSKGWNFCKVFGKKTAVLGCFTPARQKSFPARAACEWVLLKCWECILCLRSSYKASWPSRDCLRRRSTVSKQWLAYYSSFDRARKALMLAASSRQQPLRMHRHSPLHIRISKRSQRLTMFSHPYPVAKGFVHYRLLRRREKTY